MRSSSYSKYSWLLFLLIIRISFFAAIWFKLEIAFDIVLHMSLRLTSRFRRPVSSFSKSKMLLIKRHRRSES